jgi:hypothetical protein
MKSRRFWKNLSGRGTAARGGNLPALSDELNDNFYLASAARAGEIDRKSGAYDEFLFSEDGLPSMPFESSIDHHLSLTEMRLRDRGRRAYLDRQADLFSMRGQIAQAEHKILTAETALARQTERLNEQQAILEGTKTGRGGLYWPGSLPESTSRLNSAIRLSLPFLVFIVVGVVDLQIIHASFLNIPGFKDREAWLFTLPAVGVQLVFPHLIGDRLSLLFHGHSTRFLNILSCFILLVIWLVFAFVLTEIRMDFIVGLSLETGDPLNRALRLSLYAGNLIMLVGLGTWLLAMAAKHNHHQGEYSRIAFNIRGLTSRLHKAKEKGVILAANLPALKASLEVIEKSFIDAVETSRNELAEATKSVYRRSLVNHFGAVDFTASYLGESSSTVPSRQPQAPRKFISRPDAALFDTPATESTHNDAPAK